MKALCGYLKTLYRYWQTPKGHHDIIDYTRALLLIFVLIGLVFVAVRFIGENVL